MNQVSDLTSKSFLSVNLIGFKPLQDMPSWVIVGKRSFIEIVCVLYQCSHTEIAINGRRRISPMTVSEEPKGYKKSTGKEGKRKKNVEIIGNF